MLGPGPAVGVHERGSGPGDTVSLPYFEVDDMGAALARVTELGGSLIHPGERWSICRDSEGSPFALAIGGEKRGLSAAVRDRCASRVTIPTKPGAPSLSLTHAAAVAMAEVARQRRGMMGK